MNTQAELIEELREELNWCINDQVCFAIDNDNQFVEYFIKYQPQCRHIVSCVELELCRSVQALADVIVDKWTKQR